jgi:cysteine sulfinate desulfinase/cysteine desulfurase-like protein
VDYVSVSSSSGQVLAEEIEKNIRPNTCLVTVMLANNETGVIMPVAEISRFEFWPLRCGFLTFVCDYVLMLTEKYEN